MRLAEAAADAAKRLSAMDFTADNARIAELQDQIGDLDKAIERGDARQREIVATLSGHNKTDAGDVADTLLNPHADTALLSPNPELLESERESLLGGLRELRFRREDAVGAIASIKREARHRAGSAVSDLATLLAERAEAATAELLEIFASAKALNHSLDCAELRDLEAKLDFAVDGLAGQYRLARYRATFDVPPALHETLKMNAESSPAFALHLPSSVSGPILPPNSRI